MTGRYGSKSSSNSALKSCMCLLISPKREDEGHGDGKSKRINVLRCHLIRSWRDFDTFTALVDFTSLLNSFPPGHECLKGVEEEKKIVIVSTKTEINSTNRVKLKIRVIHVSRVPAIAEFTLDDRQIQFTITATLGPRNEMR